MEARVGDALASALGAAAGGVQMAGSAFAEGEAAAEAAGGLDPEAFGAVATVAEAPLDVAEVLFQGTDRHLELPPELLEAQLLPAEDVDDLLPGGLGRSRIVLRTAYLRRLICGDYPGGSACGCGSSPA